MDEISKIVSLITINLNGKYLLKQLLHSIDRLDYPKDKLEIIVVDNGSNDGSADYLESNHPGVKVIRNKLNMGFAYPCNQAARQASGEYLAFVNNDVVLDPGWLKELIATINPETGTICVASKILNSDGTKIDFVGGGINYLGFGYQKHFNKNVKHYDEHEKKELLFACGGAMLIDKDIFLDVGGFDEDYFAFFEDVDLGLRLWLMGYRVTLAPSAIAYHRHHHTTNKLSKSKIQMIQERNSLFTIYKNFSDDYLYRIFPAALTMLSVKSLSHSQKWLDDFLFDAQKDKAYNSKKKRFKKHYRHFMGKILDTICSILLDFKLGSRSSGSKKSSKHKGGRVQIAAMVHFGLNQKIMKGKRDFIQSRRKRSDKEIFTLFRDDIIDLNMSDQEMSVWRSVRDSWDITDIYKGGGAAGDIVVEEDAADFVPASHRSE